eukprot:6212589-Pleurochrysis_carterae.AAC.3
MTHFIHTQVTRINPRIYTHGEGFGCAAGGSGDPIRSAACQRARKQQQCSNACTRPPSWQQISRLGLQASIIRGRQSSARGASRRLAFKERQGSHAVSCTEDIFREWLRWRSSALAVRVRRQIGLCFLRPQVARNPPGFAFVTFEGKRRTPLSDFAQCGAGHARQKRNAFERTRLVGS